MRPPLNHTLACLAILYISSTHLLCILIAVFKSIDIWITNIRTGSFSAAILSWKKQTFVCFSRSEIDIIRRHPHNIPILVMQFLDLIRKCPLEIRNPSRPSGECSHWWSRKLGERVKVETIYSAEDVVGGDLELVMSMEMSREGDGSLVSLK